MAAAIGGRVGVLFWFAGYGAAAFSIQMALKIRHWRAARQLARNLPERPR